MPDEDEDISYRDYSPETAQQTDAVPYIEHGEELSYSSYAGGETKVEEPHTGAGAMYGDFIIEEFSTENAINKFVKYTHLSEKTVSYIISVLYIILGLTCALCALIFDEIRHTEIKKTIFPYVVGAKKIILGVMKFLKNISTKEYASTHTNVTATSVIYIIIGLMIVIESALSLTYAEGEGSWSIGFIGIVWGVYGLTEAAHAFNHAFSRIARSENFVYFLIKGIIQLVLAIMLLYDPNEHISMHIIVFGIQLIFSAVTMLPVVKAYVHRNK